MKKIIAVFGTRPEAVKMCPLILELKSRGDMNTVVCVTGQHRDMLRPVLMEFGVTPDYDLDIMQPSQTLFDITSRTLEKFRTVLEKERPDVVLVHGDTTTAFAAALACYYCHVPVGHVEAGLRTHDVRAPYPEEFNRVAIDEISDFLFAPTEKARENLLSEGKSPERVFVVGNTAIDALKYTVKANYDTVLLRRTEGRKIVVMTAHRRESREDAENFRAMISAVARACRDADACVIFPMHKSPEVRSAAEALCEYGNVITTEPLGVEDFHNICARAYLCVTDSGGIQEEAPAFSLPVLVMRDKTERPEAVACGAAKLCGTNPENIYRETYRLLTDSAAHDEMTGKKNPFGDGNSSRLIADILTERI